MAATNAAIQALIAGASRLSPSERLELARQLEKLISLDQTDRRQDMHPLTQRRAPLVEAVRAVAASVERQPTTTDYVAEYKRRRGTEDAIPSIGKVLRHFGSWQSALAGAGLLAGQARATGTHRRRNYQRRVAHWHPDSRLIECLRACAESLGRVPMVSDYVVWREERATGPAGSRAIPLDIPHYTTFRRRWGTWDAALEAAGFDPDRRARSTNTEYSQL